MRRVFVSVTPFPPTPSQVNHAVVLVGYGVDDVTGQPYYLARNSWGSAWGEGGFFRLSRGAAHGPDGMCGILLDASYPIV